MASTAATPVRRAELDEMSLEKDNWSKPAFVAELLGMDVRAVEVQPWTGGGGMSGDSSILTATIGGKEGEADATTTCKWFMKLTRAGGSEMSRAAGLAREGVFLRHAAKDATLSPLFPKVIFAFGDMASARKVTVSECVDGVQAGYFFGPGSLHNWGKDLAALTAGYGGVDEMALTLSCFGTAAELHARYWGQPEKAIAALPELRGKEWAVGEGEAQFDAVMKQAIAGWQLTKAAEDKMPEGVRGTKLDPLLVEVMDAALSKSTWAAFQAMWAGVVKTVAHGDFHPSNIVVPRPAEGGAAAPPAQPKVLLVDWEAVGVGSGPQDLGQFHISHSAPAARRANVDAALAHYHTVLLERGVEGVTMEHIKAEYVQGGLGRWVWLLAIIMGLGLPGPALQFFHDQVLAFIQDHGITAANAPICRV